MSANVESPEAVQLKQKIDDQGNIVRKLKAEGGEVGDAIQILLRLKTDYKSLTGVDLAASGNSKKSKKEKKTTAGEVAASGKKGAEPKKAKSQPTQRQAKPTGDSSAASKPAEEQQRDMKMTAVLGRLAQRASQADQLVTHLRTQLNSLRQSAALSACQAEEERLKTENEYLKVEIDNLKHRLVEVEVKNGVKQVPLPTAQSQKSCSQVTKVKAAKAAAVPQKPQVSTSCESVKVSNKQQAAAGGGKKEKKESKPKEGQQKSAGGSDRAVDISRIDMRIGKIVEVKNHPDADSLYIESVDLGEDAPRTILSGLVKHIPIQQMQDRVAIFMCNLKPAKMRGIFSHGMIMCGSTPEKVEIIVPPAGAKIGDRVYVEGFEGTPDEQLNPKKKIFEQVQPDLRVNEEGVATYKGVAWRVSGVDGLCTAPTMKDSPIK